MDIMFKKWNIDFGFRKLIEILTVKAYPKFCSRYINEQELYVQEMKHCSRYTAHLDIS